MNGHAVQEFSPSHRLFLGVDSDGCAFDTMEVKHRRCFAPQFVRWFDLEPISATAQTVWNFVNLYSATRGINRYAGLAATLHLLGDHPDVPVDTGVPALPAFSAWIERSPALSGSALTDAIATARRAGDRGAADELQTVAEWSRAVDEAFAGMLTDAEPFPGVRDALAAAGAHADVAVVSSAPTAVLQEQWAHAGLEGLVATIGGQELGKKTDHLTRCAVAGGYAANDMLMVGDAPGDAAAARSVGAWFFPIVPGDEAGSWRRFREQALPRFVDGAWTGDYQDQLEQDFYRHLPETPPWKAAPTRT